MTISLNSANDIPESVMPVRDKRLCAVCGAKVQGMRRDTCDHICKVARHYGRTRFEQLVHEDRVDAMLEAPEWASACSDDDIWELTHQRIGLPVGARRTHCMSPPCTLEPASKTKERRQKYRPRK